MNDAQMDGMAMGDSRMDSMAMGDSRMDSMAMGDSRMDGMAMGGMAMDDMAGAPQIVHAVHMARQQSERAETLMTYILLVALEADREANLIRLRATRDMFEQIQRGLRDGDGRLGLHAPSNTDVLGSIYVVDGEWARIAPIIQRCLESGHVTPEQVRSLVLLKPRLATELENMADRIGYFVLGGSGHSILSTTINVAQSQLALLGQMTNQYLLIAYGQNEEMHWIALQQSYAQFDRALTGLIDGDADLQVLAAPTLHLRDRYAEVSSMWQDFRALLERATETGLTDIRSIMQVTSQVSPLAEALEDAVGQYHLL